MIHASIAEAYPAFRKHITREKTARDKLESTKERKEEANMLSKPVCKFSNPIIANPAILVEMSTEQEMVESFRKEWFRKQAARENTARVIIQPS